MEINERKKAALYAYWILKLKPFTIVDSRYVGRPGTSAINEKFALYIIVSALFRTGRLAGDCGTTRDYINELEFSFRYRDISMGSMFLIVESLNTETFAHSFL